MARDGSICRWLKMEPPQLAARKESMPLIQQDVLKVAEGSRRNALPALEVERWRRLPNVPLTGEEVKAPLGEWRAKEEILAQRTLCEL